MAAKESLTSFLQKTSIATNREIVTWLLRLSMPIVMAQFMNILMQYIDAAMAGSLGAEASAAIGLVTTTVWFMGGICVAVSTGFSVQLAQLFGAMQPAKARYVLRQAVLVAGCLSLLIAAAGVTFSHDLPYYLGGTEKLCLEGGSYFAILAAFLPALQLEGLAGAALQSNGQTRIAGIIAGMMCLLDIIFNFFLIYPGRVYEAAGCKLYLPGADLGVQGAALGTALAETVAMFLMFYALSRENVFHHFWRGSWQIEKETVSKAFKIGCPVGIEYMLMSSALMAVVHLIAPLGAIALAANSLAITAESICYMPGYGVAMAASPIVGQCYGAKKYQLMRNFGYYAVLLGVLLMTLMAVIMYLLAPAVFDFLTPIDAVRQTGVACLRIGMWSEPLFAASIVAAGALRGVGDTKIPAVLNLSSVWLLRLPLSFYLIAAYGVWGAWLAMCIELWYRGILQLCRLSWKFRRIK